MSQKSGEKVKNPIPRGADRFLWHLAFIAYVVFVIRYGVAYVERGATDLPSLYFGAVRAIAGQSPYDAKALQLLGQEMNQDIYPFIYPPPSLILLGSLALLPYDAARLVMLLFNHLLFLVVTGQLMRLSKKEGAHNLLLPTTLLFMAFAFPVAQTVNHGQLNLLLLALLLFAFKREDSSLSCYATGGAVALASIVKPHLGLLFIPLIYTSGVRPLLAGGAALIASTLAALALFPAATWGDWSLLTSKLASLDSGFAIMPSIAGFWNQSLTATIHRLFVDTPWSTPILAAPVLARVGTWILLAGVLGVALFQTLKKGRGAPVWACSLWLLTALLLSPATWEHHFVFAFAAIIPLARSLSNSPLLPLNLITIFAFLLLAAPPTRPGEVMPMGVVESLAQSVRAFALLWLWIRLVFEARRTPGESVNQ